MYCKADIPQMPFGCSYSRVAAAVLYVPVLFQRATVTAFEFSMGQQRLLNVMWHDYEPSISSSCAVTTVMLRTWCMWNVIPEYSFLCSLCCPIPPPFPFWNPMALFEMWGYFGKLVRFNTTRFFPFFSHAFWPCSDICCDLILCSSGVSRGMSALPALQVL